MWLPARSREVKLGQMSITFLSCTHTWMGYKTPVLFLCVVLHSVSFFPVLYLPCISCQTVGAPVWPEQPLEQSRLVCHSNVSDILLCRSCESDYCEGTKQEACSPLGKMFFVSFFFPFYCLASAFTIGHFVRPHGFTSRGEAMQIEAELHNVQHRELWCKSKLLR